MRKQREVAEQSERIVAAAKLDAEKAAAKARTDLQSSIERRLKAAEDQITSAEEKAIRAVRNRAIQVATTAVADVMAKTISTTSSDELIDASIAEIDRHLH